jgi:hypothetical protein
MSFSDSTLKGDFKMYTDWTFSGIKRFFLFFFFKLKEKKMVPRIRKTRKGFLSPNHNRKL